MEASCREPVRGSQFVRARSSHRGLSRSSERTNNRPNERRSTRNKERSKDRLDVTNRVKDPCVSERISRVNDEIGHINEQLNRLKGCSEIYNKLATNDAEEYSDSDEDVEGEEVCIWVDDKQLWVSGVLASTTCGELVRAVLPHQPGCGRTSEEDWVITECWRSMEQPLENAATILDIWNAWGDAQSEIRFTLRYADSSGDSGRGSPPSPRRRPHTKRRSRQLFPQLLRAQGDTLLLQADKLREQDRQISHLEEQTHKTRMEKHGPNYLLESYLRDIARNNELVNSEERRNELAGVGEANMSGDDHKIREGNESNDNVPVQTGEAIENHARSSEATDSPAANSDSGVGVSGSPPRPTKRRSRGRHLLREHYLTKELTDICQINANRIVQTKSDDNSETSTDELSRIQQQIDILEKLTIVNKRLQREEELIVRLGVKLRRYLCEDQISYIESEDQIVTMLNTLRMQMDNSSKEIENAAIEMERADYQLAKRKGLLDILAKEMEDVDLESQSLEGQINSPGVHDQAMYADVQYAGIQPPFDNIVCKLPLDVSNQFVNANYSVPNYPLDTLV